MATRYETVTKAQLVADGLTFLDELGETITRLIAGDEDDTESVLAIVDLDDELAGGLDGDSVNPDSPSGSRISRTGVFELKASQEVLRSDIFVRSTGERWSVVRVAARDDAMQSVFVRRVDGGTSKRARIKP